jgi:hypothetical protein
MTGINFFTSLYEKPDGDGLDLARAWRISMSTMFAPLYLFQRADHPVPNGQLPTPVSGGFKIMLDVPTTIDLMLIRGHDTNIASRGGVDMAKEIQEFADKSLILLNGEYACAGAPGLIDNVTRTLFENVKSDPAQHAKFQEYFPKPDKFMQFSYCMTSQYVMGTMYLLSTMTAMEAAYKQLESERKYTPDTDSNNKLSAYERRRRIALDVVIEPTNSESVLKQFASLVENESIWGVDVANKLNIRDSLDLSLGFVRNVDSMSPRDISQAHTQYQIGIENQLVLAQQKADMALGTTGMFPKEIEFDRTKRSPARLLKNIL